MTQPFHHFIPKVILRNFTNGQSESLWFYKDPKPNPHPMRKGIKPKPEPRNIESIFGARGLNSYRTFDGNKTLRVEKFLGDSIENKWKDVLTALIACKASEQLQEIDSHYGVIIRQMFLTMLRRSPEAFGKSLSRERVQSNLLFSKAKEELVSEGAITPIEAAEVFHSTEIERLVREVEITHITMPPNPELWHYLELCGLGILRIKHGSCPLLISSNPVLFYGGQDGLFKGRSVVMPISSKVLISLDISLRDYPVTLMNKRQAASVNHFSAQQSTAIASFEKSVVMKYQKYVRRWNADLIW